MSSPVVTRFAPSPTGYLHIGGARTALFNWAYAKRHGGKMLLRIEDTDRERSNAAAIDAIIEGLTWLGLDWAGEPVSQFGRAHRHREVAGELLAQGKAYRCFCTPQELEAMRSLAEAEKRPIRYDGAWRDRDPASAPVGARPVIRFRSPDDGSTVVDDHVQGHVVFANKDLDDLIILRSDGNPTYNLSVVVDDHDMGVTHIIRGVDHLTNAARQTQIYQAMGWRVPEMSHIPLIHGPDGAKLSKRHGALGVEAYRAMGYLPDAMRNYLARLGWSHGDDEIFSTDQLVEWFGLENVGKSPARFDFAKLENLNGHYIRHTLDASLLEQFLKFLPYIEGGKHMLARIDEEMRLKLLKAMPHIKERAKTLVELRKSVEFLFKDEVELEPKARDVLAKDGANTLEAYVPYIQEQLTDSDWTAENIRKHSVSFASRIPLKIGEIAQPIRAAATGSTVSFGAFEILEVLGREEALKRLRSGSKFKKDGSKDQVS